MRGRPRLDERIVDILETYNKTWLTIDDIAYVAARAGRPVSTKTIRRALDREPLASRVYRRAVVGARGTRKYQYMIPERSYLKEESA